MQDRSHQIAVLNHQVFNLTTDTAIPVLMKPKTISGSPASGLCCLGLHCQPAAAHLQMQLHPDLLSSDSIEICYELLCTSIRYKNSVLNAM